MKLNDYIKNHSLTEREVRNFIAAFCDVDLKKIKMWEKNPKTIWRKYYPLIEKATLGKVTVDDLRVIEGV